MRLIDAAIKDLEMIGDCRTCGNKTPFCDSNPDSCSGYKWRGVPPNATDDNQPLTLEDLREMDGEPVFIKCLFNDELSSYVVFDKRRDSAGIFTRLFYSSFDYYGDEWLAYRRKPEDAHA